MVAIAITRTDLTAAALRAAAAKSRDAAGGSADAGAGAGAGGRGPEDCGGDLRHGSANVAGLGASLQRGWGWPGFRTSGVRRAHGGSVPIRCPSSWPGWRPVPIRRPFRWGTAWCAGGGRTCNGGSRTVSGWSCTSGRWANTWRRSATGGFRCARATPRPIRRRRTLSKKLPRGGSGGDPGGGAGQAARGLVPGRGTGRPAGHPHPGLGKARHAAAGAARHPLPVGLHLRRGLPRARHRRRVSSCPSPIPAR